MKEIMEEYYNLHSIKNKKELSFVLEGCSTCKKYDACSLNELLNESKNQIVLPLASNIIIRKNDIPECDNYIHNSPYTKKESSHVEAYKNVQETSIDFQI